MLWVNNNNEQRFRQPSNIEDWFPIDEKSEAGIYILNNFPILEFSWGEDGQVVASVSPTKEAKFQRVKEREENKQLIEEKLSEALFSLEDTDYQIIKNMEILLLKLQPTLTDVEFPYDIQTLHTERQKARDQVNEAQVQMTNFKNGLTS